MYRIVTRVVVIRLVCVFVVLEGWGGCDIPLHCFVIFYCDKLHLSLISKVVKMNKFTQVKTFRIYC